MRTNNNGHGTTVDWKLTPRDYGNTFKYAGAMLYEHWQHEHSAWGIVRQPTEDRPYECQVCRDLWLRASSAYYRDQGTKIEDTSTPVPFMAIVELVMAMAQPARDEAEADQDD